jgi:hypothetical protein
MEGLKENHEEPQKKEPGYRLATGWTTEGSEFESRQVQEFTPRRLDRLWGPPGLLFNGYRGRFPRG